jgi:hypothetical protein
VIGRDDRLPLARLAASQDAGDRRLAEAARASGLITCDNGRFGSAALVARADVIVTAGHLFFGIADIRRGRVACVYIHDGMPGSPRIPVELASLRLGAERVTGVNICSNGRDWAVMRLARPVPGVTPYQIASGVPAAGAPAAMVSHGGSTAAALRGPGGHAGRCQVRDLIGPCRQTNLPLILTDCDAETGSSGGALLVEDGGRWAIGGITRGASPAGATAYDRERAYHMAVPIAGPLARAIREMAGR